MEAQYGKFLDMIRVVRINVPLVDVLAGMLNYGKFLKELVRNKHKLEQFSSTFLSDESSAIIQNKVPPKLGDPKSFLIPCTFSKKNSCNALADLGASINLMPYSLYAKLSLETLKLTKMSFNLVSSDPISSSTFFLPLSSAREEHSNMSSNTPDYIYPIIVPYDFDVEDAFSSTNTPDYTPVSPDYSLASPGNTSPDPSDDLSKYLLASLAISPFHDDPYMKVMQAYNATINELPIPLP
ncbi:reverse transcriptase domain-containing protein [Tanacetum coccineum]|uniref:Reverse transcriptase domain-containing protein n=1 Tax=Tanacetum coccineum TaxID=301880 RepID=A0ABQ4YZN7_9ASTR